MGKSKGGWTTKIVALTDALGNLVRFELLPAHRYDTVGVPSSIDGLAFDALIADKAYAFKLARRRSGRSWGEGRDLAAPQRLAHRAIDATMYGWRHLIENFFCDLKDFKRVAIRSDKTDDSYKAMICAAATVLQSRQ